MKRAVPSTGHCPLFFEEQLLQSFTSIILKQDVGTPVGQQNYFGSVIRLAVLLAALVIAGCGGGGGGGDSGDVENGAKAPNASSSALFVTEDLAASTTLSANDPNNDPLTYTIVTNGSKGTATITDPSTGAVTYLPNANETGSDSFTFKVNDGVSDSNIATVSITITPVNDAPVAQAGSLNVNEDIVENGVLTASDVDNPTLSYRIVSNGSKGTAVITDAATGAYTYTPNPNVSGSDSFTFRANDGLLDSNTATISVTIAPVNDAPVAQDGSLATDEDTAGSSVLTAGDIDSSTLNYSIVTNGSKGTAVITNIATGAYTYTPDPDANGSDSFTFKANDGLSDSNTATVSVSITPVNDAPVAEAGTLTTDEDTAGNGVLVATDVDSASLTYSIVANGSKGTAVITNATTGAYTYTPDDPDVNGSDSFTFKASDGELESNTETIAVTITPVNDPPVAIDGCGTTPQAETLTGFLNATDPDQSDSLYFSLGADGSAGKTIETANGGWVEIIDQGTGEFTYQPAAAGSGFGRGIDSFEYRVTDDSEGASSSATQTVIVDQKIMPLGDSITAGEEWLGSEYLADNLMVGYRESLHDSLTGAGYSFDFVGSVNLHGGATTFTDIEHEGHGGFNAIHIKDGVQAWLDLNPADIILLHAGTNDLTVIPTDETHIEAILDEIDIWENGTSGNPITVVLALIIDQDPIEPYVTTFNTAVRDMALTRIGNGDDIIIVDQQNALSYPAHLSDKLHPNATGYDKMADAWFTALETVVDKCP